MISVRLKNLTTHKEVVYKIKINEGTILEDCLKEIGINSIEENYCIVINGVIQQPQYILKEGDEIEIFHAMCGG